MGRSTKSCFNIISCGCINESDVSSENNGHDKPGWSLRKKSARRQVPNSSVDAEKIPSSEHKEIPEAISITSEPQVNSNISEKTSDSIWTEETPILIIKNAAVSTMQEDNVKCEPVPDESESESESAVLVIQAAVRRFLAERRLIKHKNVVKLQAAVRGHLVRNHAVGTLRCVQAIVKMQALVRARKEKGVQNAGINSTSTHISIEKLLSNRLARQLLESTPRTKQINIKCDPSKSDSAWNWLERWMSVSSPETLQPHTPDHDQDKVVNNTESEVKMVISANSVGEATVRFEQKESVISIEEDPVSESVVIPVSETKPEPIPEKPLSETKPKTIPENPVSEAKPIEECSNVKTHEEDPISESAMIPVSETKPIPENPVSETKPIPENPTSETKPIPESPTSETKPIAAEQDSEGRKNVFGSRKASNPAFIAAQSRFEELTSPKTNPLKSPNSSNQDDGAGSGTDPPADVCSCDPLKSAISSNQNDVAGSFSPADISSSDLQKPDNEVVACADTDSSAPGKATLITDAEPRDSRVAQNGGSECGTELSITSTLDSPHQFEIENKKFEETQISNNNGVDIVMPAKQVDEKRDDSDNELEPKPELIHHEYKSNAHEQTVPESPGSHMTNLESQGTPSSQISTTSKKKTKTDKKVSSPTLKAWSYSKKSSPVSSSLDSGLRNSLEQLPKEPKPVKRRTATGSPKPDDIDHEQLVPGYMQTTESARAKVVAGGSPRSSPDVHDKETYLKKRHSLPGVVNSRHGSPHIQRSMSQALQSTKGNSNQERKWQR